MLMDLMEEGTMDEDTLKDALMNSKEELAIKLENYCKFIKNLESDIAGLKEEEKRLASKRKTMENTIERAKEAMKYAMEASGMEKVKGTLFTITIQANPEKVVMETEDVSSIPADYLRMKDPEIDKAKIKEDLKAGVELSFAHLEKSRGVRIR
jgi:hypothetical protein